MIEHIVLSGSGPNGLIQLGMLQQLINSNVVCIENIKSIHATSAGSIIGVLLCLHIPIQDIIDYFVHRPWDKWFKPNMFQFMESNGLVSSDCFQELLTPFFNTYEVSISSTLKELYDRTGIDFHIFTTSVINLTSVDLNHTDFPDVPIIQAISMSSSIPILFTPIKYKEDYYIDGGLLNYCPFLQAEKDSVLVLKIDYVPSLDLQCTSHFMQHLILKIFEILSTKGIYEGKYVYCFNAKSLFCPSLWEQSLSSKIVRQSMVDMGIEFIKN
jgi:predicted acylesterase/phospholipase RssA